jgi:hypothetical protein
MTSTRNDHEVLSGDSLAVADGEYPPRDDIDGGTAPGLTARGDFIDETVAFWQQRTKRKLTREDGREIIENMTGFFRVLLEWDRAEAEGKAARPNPIK